MQEKFQVFNSRSCLNAINFRQNERFFFSSFQKREITTFDLTEEQDKYNYFSLCQLAKKQGGKKGFGQGKN